MSATSVEDFPGDPTPAARLAAERLAEGVLPEEDDGWADAVLAAGDPKAAPSYADQVRAQLDRLRARQEAGRLFKLEEAQAQDEPEFVRLDRFLAVADQQQRFLIDGLWPAGGSVLVAAQYKAGKTTTRNNAARCLVDGDPFLGRFAVTPPAGRVVIIDNELGEDMLRRWLRDQAIRNTEQVAVLQLRGKVGTFDLLDRDTRSRWAAKLRALDTSVVLFDCLRPVLDALGLSEDKDAGQFLVAFDALLAEAGATEGAVIHHMGHGGERSRGDSRLRDWPDAEWRLLREKTDDGDDEAPDARRYFTAFGRDVSVPEGLLAYDPDTRLLTLAGGTRRQEKAAAGIPEVLAYLEQNPGASQRAVERAMVDVLGGAKAGRAALKSAIDRGQVDVADGPNRSHLHFLTTPGAPGAPECAQTHPAHPGGECASAPIGAHGAPPATTDPDQPELEPAHGAPEEDQW